MGFIGTEILKKLPWGSFIVGGDHLRFPAFAPGAKKRGTGTRAPVGAPSSEDDGCRCRVSRRYDLAGARLEAGQWRMIVKT
jgi:hypothetical protein